VDSALLMFLLAKTGLFARLCCRPAGAFAVSSQPLGRQPSRVFRTPLYGV